MLKRWLPPQFQVVTKGRILGHDGAAGPQVDVLVLSPSYPKGLLGKKLYLAGGVAAAFECKTTLKSAHVEKTFENAAKIQRLFPKRSGSPYRELHSPMIYGLLAHSHSWGAHGSTPIDNVTEKIRQAESVSTAHPREIPDVLCVADLETWRTNKIITSDIRWHDGIPTLVGMQVRTAYLARSLRNEDPNVPEPLHNVPPIGDLLTYLLLRLAWEHPEVRKLAFYFQRALGNESAGQMRTWPTNIFSKRVRERVEAGAVTGGSSSLDVWDEWAIVFP